MEGYEDMIKTLEALINEDRKHREAAKKREEIRKRLEEEEKEKEDGSCTCTILGGMVDINDLVKLLDGIVALSEKDKAKEDSTQEEAEDPKPCGKPSCEGCDEFLEGDFQDYVGGMVVSALPVEDDGEPLYFCIVDDEEFYVPKAVFDKYFVKL